ncbi:MAG: class I SAM-dependent methyltransferase [Thermoanaerobaculia bacterium]|nr:class I SAM-dependent methyltransferase [Thermoanaerobaculia bacterium]
MTPHAVAELYDSWSSFQNSRLDAYPCELHIHRTVMLEHLSPGSRILDVGAGPGRYAIELSRAGHRIVAGDVSPIQVELARRNVAEAGVALGQDDGEADDRPSAGVESVDELDAVDLSRFPNESFDAVVALGPFYHLQSIDERRRAASEVTRVLRPGGILFASFMPRAFWLSMALHTFVTDPAAPSAQLEELERLLERGLLGKVRSPQLKASWFCRIEEIAPLFSEQGLDQIRLLASSGVVAVWSRPDTWRGLAEREPVVRRKVLDLVLRTASDPYVLGMSDQVLFIGKKSP